MGKKEIARLAGSAVMLALLVPGGASAVQPDAALGSSGELYVVKAGTYGALFPGRRQTDAANRILSLEIGRPGQLPSRQPVPSTEGTDVELSPSVTYEEASHRLYVLWESRSSATYSVLKLISFDGTRWSDAIEVSGNPASAKGVPHLAITHDTIQMPAADGSRVDRHRSTLHMVWAEGDGRSAKSYYTPIILVDGEYLGWNPVYSLGELDSPEVAASASDPASSLLQSPTVVAGRDGRTVVVSFVSAATRRQTSIQVNLLPGELQQIADGTRAVIIDAGNRLGLSLPAGRPQLAEKARAALIESGAAFEEDVVRTLVERVQGEILDSDLTDLTSLADKTRAVIIDAGARFSHRGLRPSQQKQARMQRIDQVNSDPRRTNQPALDGALGHLIEFSALASRPAPQVGTGPVEVFPSATGEQTIVAWTQGDKVFYRESQGDGWSDVRELWLSDASSLARTFEILDQRVRAR